MLIANLLNENIEEEILDEAVERQMRRYGDKMKISYRCKDGDKKGRVVSQPTECTMRKNPKRVRAGLHSSRIKKGERVRKSQFTKRKTLSQILVRRNKMMKGPTADVVTKDNPKTDAVTSKGSKGTTGTKGTS